MFILTLDVWAQTASFRIPEQHTFQPTLPLPPITTLIGLMGAALGLTFDEAIAFKKKHAIAFGVTGSHAGEMRDLTCGSTLRSKRTRPLGMYSFESM